jgi:hypothetical protein
MNYGYPFHQREGEQRNNKPDWRFVLLGAMCVVLFMVHRCTAPKTKTKWREKVTIDTIYTSSIDTVYEKKVIYVETEIPAPSDTIYVDSTHMGLSRLVYTPSHNDTLLEANFRVVVDGVLVEHNFNYTPKYPKYIYTRDTFRINTNTVSIQDRNQLFLGLEVGGNNAMFNVSPKVSLRAKNGFIYSYRYGLIDKTHNIGVQKLIRLKK